MRRARRCGTDPHTDSANVHKVESIPLKATAGGGRTGTPGFPPRDHGVPTRRPRSCRVPGTTRSSFRSGRPPCTPTGPTRPPARIRARRGPPTRTWRRHRPRKRRRRRRPRRRNRKTPHGHAGAPPRTRPAHGKERGARKDTEDRRRRHGRTTDAPGPKGRRTPTWPHRGRRRTADARTAPRGRRRAALRRVAPRTGRQRTRPTSAPREPLPQTRPGRKPCADALPHRPAAWQNHGPRLAGSQTAAAPPCLRSTVTPLRGESACAIFVATGESRQALRGVAEMVRVAPWCSWQVRWARSSRFTKIIP